MARAARVLLFAYVLAGACAPRSRPTQSASAPAVPTAPAPPAPPPPSHVVIRVDRVQVSAHRSNGTSWDEPQAVTKKSDAGCEFLSAVAGFGVGAMYGPAAGAVANKGMGVLCVDTTPLPQVQQDPSLPDLQIALAAAAEPQFLSERVDNVTQYVFRYRFLVPFAAIPADGLKFEVVDVDASSYENLGLIRVSRDDVLATMNSTTRVLMRSAQQIEQMEFFIEPYAMQPAGSFTVQAKAGARSSDATVIAGEVVDATAEGSWFIGSWNAAKIGPEGYPGGGPTEYNFAVPPLITARHGCAFMAIGNRRRGASLVTPSGRFLSATTGPLIGGINDQDPGNNAGSVTFRYSMRAPTTAEWLARRAIP
jgi:hypothetical protein